jgi:hypothetical protein
MCNIVDSYLRSSGSSNSVCKVTLQLPNIQHNEANIKNNLIQEFVCLFVCLIWWGRHCFFLSENSDFKFLQNTSKVGKLEYACFPTLYY